MKYTHILKSHYDIGYNNFFNQFRDEYEFYYDMPESIRINFINSMFYLYNCHAVLWTYNNETGITFDSEKYFNAFVLKYS